MKEGTVVTLEGRDAFLDAFCMQYSTSIVTIDRALAEIPDDNPNKTELMRFRQLIASANSNADIKLVDAWLHALMIGLKAACHTIPLALVGEKVKKSASLGHQATHGTRAEKNARWDKYRNDCLIVAMNNPKWGLETIRQEVATINGVSLRTVERQTGDLKTLLRNTI